MHPPIRRHAGALLAAVGLLGLIGSFLAMAGESLPYQDPTPAMLAAQADRIQAWQWAMFGSVLVFVGGGLVDWRSRRRRRGR